MKKSFITWVPESTLFSIQDIWFSMARVCIGIFFITLLKPIEL